jgi:glucosamine-6-phosphate deaminase
MSGRVKARETVARETPAASATWLIVGASRRLLRSTIDIPAARRPANLAAAVMTDAVALTRNRLHRIVQPVPVAGNTGAGLAPIHLQPREENIPMKSMVAPLQPTRHRRVERLGVCSYATRAAMGRAAAHDIATEIRARLTIAAGVRMIFAAAPSQNDMIEALIAEPGIDWRRVTAFHMDEYIGLPEAAPQRFAMWLQERLFGRLPFAAVHPIRPEPDADQAAAHYAALLDAAPIDIVCLGIGVNGHLAFNDPPVADFADPLDVKIVELDDICRQQQVDDQCFADFASVPARALTLTIPRLLRAERLFAVVPGDQKREAIRNTLHGPITTACPASILRRHADCTLYIDAGSDPDG